MKYLLFILLLSTTSYSQTLSDTTITIGAAKYIVYDEDGGYIDADQELLYKQKPKAKLFSFDGVRVGTFYKFGGGVDNDLLYSVRSGVSIREKTNINAQVLIGLKYQDLYYKVGIEHRIF